MTGLDLAPKRFMRGLSTNQTTSGFGKISELPEGSDDICSWG